MKLIIKTKDIELEYEDGYSMLEPQVKDRIIELIKTIYSSQPTYIPTGTVEEIFNAKKELTSQLPGINVNDVKPSNPQMVKENFSIKNK
jgi:hypothetical protein